MNADEWNQLRLQLKARRNELGLTQWDVAQAIYRHQSIISEWERGRTIPTVTNLIAWARTLNLAVVLSAPGELWFK